MYCAIGWLSRWCGLLTWRWLLYCVLRRESFASSLRQKAVFVGWNDECERAVRRFGDGRSQQISVSGIITPPSAAVSIWKLPPATFRCSDPTRGCGRSCVQFRRGYRDGGGRHADRHQMLELAETCGKEFIDFKLVPSCFQILISGLQLESIHGMPVLGIGKLPLHHAFNNAAKRAVDIVGSIIGLILFAR
jgi:hypothetical protein